jgi:hypothetical protein
MNPVDDQLNRLMKSAKRSAVTAREAPLAVQRARLMAGWRACAPGETGDFWVAWFRFAAIGACVLALASLAWNRHEVTFGVGDELSFADAAVRTGVNHD